ncbi:MAG: ribbon-helix-helix protein, CopG family [Terriglobales bacterium]
MSNTLTIRLTKDVMERLRERARRTGLPAGRIVRQSLEKALSDDPDTNEEPPWRKYVGIIKGGPRDLSSRKGFSRK